MAPKPQPSRKGKKAWRKNVDVTDVNDALQAKRERQILLGEDGGEAFVIDTAGDMGVSKPKKVSKITDILTNKSKVAPLGTMSRKKRVTTAQKEHLMALAGRSLTQSAFAARLSEEGVDTATNEDIWASAPKEIDHSPPVTSWTAPTRVPNTMKMGAVKLTADVEDITDPTHGGKSYNPSKEAWMSLIAKTSAPEEKKEIERQQMEAKRQRIQYLIDTLADDEVREISDTEDVIENEEDRFKISTNPAVQWARKGRTQRNKEARSKAAKKLKQQLREIEKINADIGDLERIEADVIEKLKSHKPPSSKQRTYDTHGATPVSFKPIEVKLSDELTSDLRSLKPEGNLLYDQMHKLQAAGFTEPTVERVRAPKYKRRVVEKSRNW